MISRVADERGFGVVEVLLVCLVTILIASASIIVLKRNGYSETKKVDNASQKTDQTQKASVQPVQPAQKYLVVKEWGVRFPYSGTDVFSYKLFEDGNGLAVNSAQLATKDEACTFKGAGMIIRLKPNNNAYASGNGPTVAQQAINRPDMYVHFSDYYYQFVHDQAACGSITSRDENAANDRVENFLMKIESVD